MTVPATGFDPVHDSQATFRVLLQAMARPGAVASLPVPDPRCPAAGAGWLAAALLTLLDHEVHVAVVPVDDGEADATALRRYLTAVTGSRLAPDEQADYVVVLGTPPPDLIVRLKRGSLAYPDESATLLCLVPSLTAAGALDLGLAGPGVPRATRLRLAGLSASALAALADANSEPPLGVDLVLIDVAGRVVCLPRSTRVTVAPGNGRASAGVPAGR